MAEFKNSGVHVREYLWDFAVDGGATGFIDLSTKVNKDKLPAGAIVKDVTFRVLTACTSGGSATLAVGNSADQDGYIAPVAVASLTADACYTAAQGAGALLWDNTNDAGLAYAVTSTANTQNVGVLIATAPMTAGKVVVLVEYYVPSL